MTFNPQAHAAKWSDLPTLVAIQQFSDEDRETASDVAYMKTLAEDIRDLCHRTSDTIAPWPETVWPHQQPWPTDHAAFLITQWALHTNTQTTLEAVIQAALGGAA